MKINKVVAEVVADNILSSATKLYNLTKYYTDKMKEAETVEEIMDYKKKILLKWLSEFPIFSQHCYFCEYHNNHCESCEYADYHGVCEEDDLSAEFFNKLINIVRNYQEEETVNSWHMIEAVYRLLRIVVNEEYYRGEIYEANQLDAP